MSKAQHTPGPWTVWKNGQTIDAPREPDGSRKIVAVTKGDTYEEQTGNARLIAAAPELLEALESALRYIEVSTAYKGAMTADQVEAAIKDKYFPSEIEIGANSCNTLARFNFLEARAAIAKAKGE